MSLNKRGFKFEHTSQPIYLSFSILADRLITFALKVEYPHAAWIKPGIVLMKPGIIQMKPGIVLMKLGIILMKPGHTVFK